MFRVVDGKELTEEQYQIFVSKYKNNDIRVKQIRDDMGITYGEYRRLLEMGVERGDLEKRHRNNVKTRGKNNAKYYSYNKRANRYVVKNPITEKSRLFPTEKQAKEYVKRIKNNNWIDEEPVKKYTPRCGPLSFPLEVRKEYYGNKVGYFRVKKTSQTTKDGSQYYCYRYYDDLKKYHGLFSTSIEALKEKVSSKNLPWMNKDEMYNFLKEEEML